jgi:hypothetical protein
VKAEKILWVNNFEFIAVLATYCRKIFSALASETRGGRGTVAYRSRVESEDFAVRSNKTERVHRFAPDEVHRS